MTSGSRLSLGMGRSVFMEEISDGKWWGQENGVVYHVTVQEALLAARAELLCPKYRFALSNAKGNRL